MTIESRPEATRKACRTARSWAACRDRGESPGARRWYPASQRASSSGFSSAETYTSVRLHVEEWPPRGQGRADSASASAGARRGTPRAHARAARSGWFNPSVNSGAAKAAIIRGFSLPGANPGVTRRRGACACTGFDIGVDAEAVALEHVALLAGGTHHHHRIARLRALHPAHDLDAIDARHLDVEQHEARCVGGIAPGAAPLQNRKSSFGAVLTQVTTLADSPRGACSVPARRLRRRSSTSRIATAGLGAGQTAADRELDQRGKMVDVELVHEPVAVGVDALRRQA